MPNVRIIVVDAQELVVDGLRYRFTETPDLVIVAHACDGKALFDLLRTHEADLVVIDVSVPGMDGIDATRKLRKDHPKVKVIAHSELADIEYVNSMLIEGASGYVLKNGPRDELPTAISMVMRGEHYLSDDVRRNIEKGYAYTDKRPDGEYIGLTPREREIIRLIASEKTNDEIGAALFLSTETVKTHRKKLMTKLNVRSSAGLVKYAVDRKWV